LSSRTASSAASIGGSAGTPVLIALAVAFAEGRLAAGKQPASRDRRPDPHQELVSLEGPPDMP